MSPSRAVSPAARPVRWGQGRISQTLAYYVAFVALGLVAACFGPTLPALAAQANASLSAISYLFTAGSLGYLIGSYWGGRLFDRVPGHPLIAAMLLVMAAGLSVVPALRVVGLLVGVRLILGLAQSTLDVGANVLVVWVHGERVGPFMNGLHFCFGVGAFLSPLIVARIVQISGGIAWAYWALALLVLPASLCLLRLPSPTIQAQPHGPANESGNRALVALIALLFLLYVGAEIAFGDWVFTYALRMNLADATTAAYLASTFWGALTLGRLLAVPIAARLAPRLMLLGDLAGCVVGLGMMVLWPHSTAVLWLGTFATGFSMASIYPTLLSLAGCHMALSGQITGLFAAASSVGGMTLPWLIGQLFEPVGPQVVPAAVLGAMGLALGMFALLDLLVIRRVS